MERPLTSALTTHHQSSAIQQTHPPYLHHLAHQIQHNLQYKHDWTDLRIHTRSPVNSSRVLPRPLISGMPPQRVYIHPDEQIEILKREKLLQKRPPKNRGAMMNEAKSAKDIVGAAEVDAEEMVKKRDIEREWILPTHLREKWTLRKFAEVFDAIDYPSSSSSFSSPSGTGNGNGNGNGNGEGTVDDIDEDNEREEEIVGTDHQGINERRRTEKGRRDLKRVLLATVGDDSTVVYYIVHDGIVKPRQN